jgi:hypothetical protein
VTRRRTAARLVAVLAVAVGALTSCRVSGLQLRVDDRLRFSSPQEGHRVQLPVTVRWAMRDFQATGLDGSRDDGRGAFVVFVDRAPMAAGKDLRSIASGDAGCRRDPRCPDLSYLAEQHVFVTTEASLTIDRLPKAVDGVGDEQHSVTVVLVDGSSRRIGESAWYLPFTTKRAST